MFFLCWPGVSWEKSHKTTRLRPKPTLRKLTASLPLKKGWMEDYIWYTFLLRLGLFSKGNLLLALKYIGDEKKTVPIPKKLPFWGAQTPQSRQKWTLKVFICHVCLLLLLHQTTTTTATTTTTRTTRTLGRIIMFMPNYNLNTLLNFGLKKKNKKNICCFLASSGKSMSANRASAKGCGTLCLSVCWTQIDGSFGCFFVKISFGDHDDVMI